MRGCHSPGSGRIDGQIGEHVAVEQGADILMQRLAVPCQGLGLSCLEPRRLFGCRVEDQWRIQRDLIVDVLMSSKGRNASGGSLSSGRAPATSRTKGVAAPALTQVGSGKLSDGRTPPKRACGKFPRLAFMRVKLEDCTMSFLTIPEWRD